MEQNLLSLYGAKNFGFCSPLIRLTLNTKGSLIVQALIVALEDATMPKAEISLHSLTHLFMVFG